MAYNWDPVLVSFDQESEDATDDDNHEWRNGRHPEQVWPFLSLKFAESKHNHGILPPSFNV